MALESIKEIKKAEDYAASIVAKAQSDSKEIIKNANTKAMEEKTEILNGANIKAKKILDDAATDAQKETAPILEKGKKELDQLLMIPEDKFSKAVNLVIERIVKFNGNS